MTQACAPYRPLLSPALDGTLGPRDHEALERHLAACAECRAQKARLVATVDLLRRTTLIDPSADFVARLEDRLSATPAEREAARAPTLVVEPVSARRAWGALKAAAVVACLGTSSFLAMEAIFGPKAPPHPTVASRQDPSSLSPVEAPPPVAPAPPPLLPQAAPVDQPSEPERSFNTAEDLKRSILERFHDPALGTGPGANPTSEAPTTDPVPPPAVIVERPPVSPPPQGATPSSEEKTPPRPAPSASKKVDEAALARLITAIFLDTGTPDERRPEMIAALAEFPHKKAYDALASVLAGALDAKASANACRAAAWEALGTFGNEESVKTLLAVARPDETRLLLALARVRTPAAVRFLAERANDHPDRDARILVARALGRAARPDAVPGLARALGEARQDPLVRVEAALALGAIGDPAALEPLSVAISASRSKLPAVRAAAARGLGALALGATGASAARALTDPLEKDPHPYVREACALALGRSARIDVALKPLVDRLDARKEKARRVREAADAALVELTGLFRTADEWARAVNVAKETPPLRAPGSLAVAASGGFERLLASGQGTVLVLDRSASMEQLGRMALAKKTALGVLGALPASTPSEPVGFDVVCFADAPVTFFPRLLEPVPENVDAARAGLERQRAWWARADLLRALRAALSIEGVDSIVLLTDGVTTLGVQDPEQLLLEVSRANAGIGARIHVVALEDGASPLQLDWSEARPAAESPELGFLRRLALDNRGTFVKN
jgi:HEAT repeat protein